MSDIMNHTRNERLRFLDKLDDYKVHHNDIDPRGYHVKMRSGETVGEVEGLLADTDAMLVRYVELELDDDVIKRHTAGRYTEQDRHALVPAGIITIDQSDKTVYLEGIGFSHFFDYPRYNRKQGYTTRYEVNTMDYLSGVHDYGKSYDRNTYSTDTYRNANRLDDGFYNNDFYMTNRR
ncbi:MAG: hypothetical protein WBA17_00400 [Saprospiraceae bacterium]